MEEQKCPCEQHPNFRGLRLGKKVADCAVCKAFYEQMRAAGVRESRVPKETANVVETAETEVEEEVAVVVSEEVDTPEEVSPDDDDEFVEEEDEEEDEEEPEEEEDFDLNEGALFDEDLDDII